ncbi:MAG: hypothetical protein OXN17_12890 [Candidatus Poribacteria bacterium]|nr:hypothetical protein [Candidatus Poribacteria bacterium]MDE0505576.1 hypothetical protein [Candidatus Poribacteria bacterium]
MDVLWFFLMDGDAFSHPVHLGAELPIHNALQESLSVLETTLRRHCFSLLFPCRVLVGRIEQTSQCRQQNRNVCLDDVPDDVVVNAQKSESY